MAQFCDRFGWEAYWGMGRRWWNRRWPTTDGIIPWRLFFLMEAQQAHLLALDRLTWSSAVIQALAVAFGDEQKARRMMEKLQGEAFPLVPSNRKKEGDGADD